MCASTPFFPTDSHGRSLVLHLIKFIGITITKLPGDRMISNSLRVRIVPYHFPSILLSSWYLPVVCPLLIPSLRASCEKRLSSLDFVATKLRLKKANPISLRSPLPHISPGSPCPIEVDLEPVRISSNVPLKPPTQCQRPRHLSLVIPVLSLLFHTSFNSRSLFSLAYK